MLGLQQNMKNFLIYFSCILITIACFNILHAEEISLSPTEVVRLLLDSIGQKNWEKSIEFLSSSFLEKHKQKVLAGEYFKLSHKKDHTAFYTPIAVVCAQWREESNGNVAIVTLNLGDQTGKGLLGVTEVKLVKENNQWKVNEF